MNADEIRKRAIECGEAFQKMCDSVVFDDDTMSCPCEFDCLGDSAACSAVYCYEHGFADGVEEGRNEVITELLETSKDWDRVREDMLNKFAEWCKQKGYGCYDWKMLIEQYEQEAGIGDFLKGESK